jgi:hypothetical protein
VFTQPLPYNDKGLAGVKGDRQTHIHQGDLISFLLFFQNKGSSIKIFVYKCCFTNFAELKIKLTLR